MLRLLSDSVLDGPHNMARDEALLAAGGPPTLRLYRWQPATLSLGLFQDHDLVTASLPAPCPVVRRITGGGAIMHIHEVTYAVVGDLGQGGFPDRVRDCYPLLHGAILRELARRGAQLDRQPNSIGDRRYQREPRCFASPAADDLVAPDGGKALGSAGRNRGGRVLVHGSLKLASNDWDGPAVSGCGLDAAAASEAIVCALASCFGGTEPGTMSEAEQALEADIRQARYGSDGWVRRREGPRP